MPSPFPGMDPYLERRTIWPDFHDRLITYLCAALQPVLRPRYLALSQDRLAFGVLEPAIFKLLHEEMREPFIQIIEPAAGNRVVTAIEVLSPDNKVPGSGSDSYLKKREEFWASRTNLVEIDLLREGQRTVRISAEKLATLERFHYLTVVTRRWPAQQEVYAIPLERRLPVLGIPLAQDDKDVPLDLQAAFTRCWDEGPYPELLSYEGPPPGRLSDEELAWCDKILRDSGMRGKTNGAPAN